MSMKYIILAVFIFVVLHLALIPLGNEAINAEAATHLNDVSSFGLVHQSQTFGVMDIPKAGYNYFSSLLWIILHGYLGNPLFSGGFQLIGWIVLAPIFAAYAFGLIYTFYTIVSLVLSG